MPNEVPPKKGPKMATITSSIRRKSAKQELLDEFAGMMDKAEKEMTVRQFRKAVKESNKALDRALSHRKPRSSTA